MSTSNFSCSSCGADFTFTNTKPDQDLLFYSPEYGEKGMHYLYSIFRFRPKNGDPESNILTSIYQKECVGGASNGRKA